MHLASSAAAVLATFATAAGVGMADVPTASADNPVTQNFGTQETLNVGDGTVVAGWTVSGLHPSNDPIPYQPHGKLWEATATVKAIRGTVTPIVADFNARAASGQNYPELGDVATAQGVNPGAIPQGQETTGKLYFDVVGPNPDMVVYNSGGHDVLKWTQ